MDRFPNTLKPALVWLIPGKEGGRICRAGPFMPMADAPPIPRQPKNGRAANTLIAAVALARDSHSSSQSDVTLGSSDDEDVADRMSRGGFGLMRPG
jgi:hypothetical protein